MPDISNANVPEGNGNGNGVYHKDVKSTGPNMNDSSPQNQSLFKKTCHPDVTTATKDVDSWFLSNWKFPDQKSRDKFVGAGFSRVTCLYFPKALPQRIKSACKLLTILFLIDGQFPV
jgi:aristolochene synthase